ncbi:MAG: hypothetical protein F4Y78_02535 [Candidatus Dadabacteria bacterium]|nr:hypothetical protein [Candidatus Dadabacteria bacterium]MYA48847.1 hypothetical protein [Candidatus Dadabacteria bacterium]MYK49419.1 hypothetical protein [Candidatus Dadabacteria bacterium]
MSLQRTIGFVVCLIVLFAAACGQGPDGGDEKEPVDATPDDTLDPQPLVGKVVINDMDAAIDHWGDDAYELKTDGDGAPVVEDDTLTLTVSYSGGCKRHYFTIVADDEFLPISDSVRLDTSLAHDANDDRCEAYLTAEYEFDLTPIKTLYQETYGRDAGTVHLHLQGQDVPEDVPVITYTFE